ncbi:MAG: ornithine cyclodeaminase family protein [Saprospiraceae bacterium]|nr:ornithine cyclodeaminase family protein [Saprospiraceae bacterium]
MRQVSADQLEKLLDYPSIIDALEEAFCEDYTVPPRHHHDFPNPPLQTDSTLLLMPAWENSGLLGVKLIVASPENGQFGLPAIQGLYFLFEKKTGTPIAQLEAKTLTGIRTAAASALASRYLSRPNSERLLMVGTGALAPRLIEAHAAVRPIREVVVWGRNPEKATAVAENVQLPGVEIRPEKDLAKAIPQADIISVATLSKEPLINGKYLQAGQHLDLVGSFKPDMREADDEVVKRAVLYADVRAMASKESGDLAIPLANGLIQMKDIKADLFEMCQKIQVGRQQESDITCFKSVGHALEDLAAAKLAYQRLG